MHFETKVMDKISAKLGEARDFLGGPVVKIPPSNTVGAGSISGWETKALRAAGCGQKVKKKKNKLGEASTSKQWHPTPVLLPGKSHGWRSLVGCSPWGR